MSKTVEDGYSRVSGSSVPGVGPILAAVISDGQIIATRSDGAQPVRWRLEGATWTRLEDQASFEAAQRAAYFGIDPVEAMRCFLAARKSFPRSAS